MSIRSSILLFCLSGVVLLAGCRGTISDQPPIHVNPNMDTQEKLVPQRTSVFFADGSSMRTPPEGTVARGDLREDAAYFTGKNDDGSYAALPFVVDDMDLARGAERYMIYCQPCHGAGGDGRGVIAEPKYKYPIPPTSYHTQPILDAADGYLYEVIANGVRSMPSYRQQIPVRDRWLIVAYVRVLQQRGAPAGTTPAGTSATTSNATAPNATTPNATAPNATTNPPTTETGR